MITAEKEPTLTGNRSPGRTTRESSDDVEVINDRGSIFDLFGSLVDDTRQLLRKETQLAKEEIRSNLKKGAKGLLFMIFGAATLSAGLVALLVAVSVGTVALIMELTGLGPIPSILIGFSTSGLLMAVIGTALVLYAKKKLSPADLKPEKTVRTLKNTTNWAKEKIYE